jgi:hypothetical protein
MDSKVEKGLSEGCCRVMARGGVGLPEVLRG